MGAGSWTYVPSFGAKENCELTNTNICKLGDKVFTDYLMNVASPVAEEFFKKFNWESMISNPDRIFGRDDKTLCQNLLYISAARHVYYISILYKQSDNPISTCEENEDDMYVVPSDYCYPVNYGSLTCTSDEDVGLIGPRAGIMVKKFNEYFTETFELTSEKVMNANVYAYSLEYAMPQIFEFQGIEGHKYKTEMEKRDKTRKYKMEDIVIALYKVKKYDDLKFTALRKQFDALTEELKEIFDGYMKELGSKKFIDTSDEENLKSYSLITSTLANSKRFVENLDEDMKNVLLSHLFAAEAYYSRGTLRVVVGSMGMKGKRKEIITKRLDTFDYWASMVENWGDSIKVFLGCGENIPLKGKKAGRCWLKMSKYMYRFLYSMAKLYKNLKSNNLLDVEGQGALDLMKSWLYDYKKKGASEIPESYVRQEQPNSLQVGIQGYSSKNWRGTFVEAFGCNHDNDKFEDCMKKIQMVVLQYNYSLILYAKEYKFE